MYITTRWLVVTMLDSAGRTIYLGEQYWVRGAEVMVADRCPPVGTV